jgi:ATP-dependent helicase/nuclease subunit B
MRTIPAAGVDAWLRTGGMVVAASDRVARAVRAAYHRARQAEGLSAWTAPDVLDWSAFTHQEWERRTSGTRLVLNSFQERALWLLVIAESGLTSGWLETPRRRLADLAIQAHDLLCAYAPNFLSAASRRHWQQDAAAFSGWLSSFDDLCEQKSVVSAARLSLELLHILESEHTVRPPLVLAGFDRLLPVQQRFFESWGNWHLVELGEPAADVRSYAAPNEQGEIAACARWCRQQFDAHPHARLLIVCQDAQLRRGQIERSLLNHGGNQTPDFEFSLGVPLARVGLARAALLLLRWLDGALEEHELDWLLSSGYTASVSEETAALQAYIRALRRRGLQLTRWTLDAFLRQPAASAAPAVSWIERTTAARQALRKTSVSRHSPLEWAAVASQLLETIGWPGGRQLTSAEFQAANRWQQALDQCGSLGFDGLSMRWDEFVSELDRIVNEMLFAEESQDAPILIAGPAESAGLTADGIWFLSADEETWPAGGSTHPLLPIEVQREAAMPHASPAVDWQLAEAVTARLVRSASQVCFSYACLKEDVEARPSRLVTQPAGPPQPLPVDLRPNSPHAPHAIAFEDTPAIPLPSVPSRKSTPQLTLFDDADTQREVLKAYEVPGGSMILTSQSQCAFKAFAIARLGAQAWEPAEAGLTAAQRGQLLHAVLHSVWSDTPQGIRSSVQLHNLGAELRPFVESHVRRVFEDQLPPNAREQMPARYLELEEQRLVKLVTEWLEYERARLPFDVAATEVDAMPAVAGLTLKLRLDRVDRLSDGSLLVMDYKTGNVTPQAWELPRPDDVQLPLYAGFAVPAREEVGGLVFAKIGPGETALAGKVANAQATLFANLNGTSGLMKDPLTPAKLSEWRQAIEQLARNFIAGRADVDPREYPDTCERCKLYTLCRVREREDRLDEEEEETGAEVADE